MADIRIKDLATTATSAASDDYLALDGSANGTRKILATNVAQNVTDVTFGSSGPSAKSSIAARAARQGLVFDGTTSATISSITLSGDFTFAAWVNTPSIATSQALIGSGSDSIIAVNGPTGYPSIVKAGATTITATSGIVAGKSALVTYTRSGTSGTWYVNGVASGTGTDSNSYSAFTTFGSSSFFGLNYTGFLAPAIYNRALSAAEVVALYEAGVPAGSDYPTTAAGTDNVTNGNFSSSTGWAVGSAWTISGGVATTNGTGDGGGATELAQTGKSFKAGQRVRVTYTLASVTSGSFRIIFYGGTSNVFTTTRTSSGTYTEEITLTGGATAFQTTRDGTALNNGATLDNLSIVSLGLLLAPDAGQAGGGLTWYDTSGNAANITLPASGVTWNVPSSLKVGSGFQVAKEIAYGAAGNATFTIGEAGPAHSADNNRNIAYRWKYDKTASTGAGGSFSLLPMVANYPSLPTEGSVYLTVTNSGNLLLKSDGVDSSNGKLQLATHTTSAGGIGFGTDVSVYRNGSNSLFVNAATFTLASTGDLRWDGGGYVTIGASSSLVFRNLSAASILTLSGSDQSATFAGTVTGNKGSVINAVSGVPALRLEGAGSANSNYGLRINAGLSASDYGLFVVDDTSTDAYFIVRGDGTAKFWKNTEVAGALAIGNTVQTAAAVASTHKVTISIGGVTYYLLATNV